MGSVIHYALNFIFELNIKDSYYTDNCFRCHLYLDPYARIQRCPKCKQLEPYRKIFDLHISSKYKDIITHLRWDRKLKCYTDECDIESNILRYYAIRIYLD